MAEQTQEQQKAYVDGLSLCSNVCGLERYLKEIKENKKPNSSVEFNELVSNLSTNGENPALFIDATPAHVEGKAKQYVDDQSRPIKRFLDQYGNKVIEDFLSIINSKLNTNKSLEKLVEDITNTKDENEKEIKIKNLSVTAYESIGRMLAQYTPNDSDEEIKKISSIIKEKLSLSENKIAENVDKSLTERYNLKYGTSGLHLNYAEYHEKEMQVLYRLLGSKFVKINEKNEIKLDSDNFKKIYNTEENLKEIGPTVLAELYINRE